MIKRRHNMMSDEGWQEFKKRMEERSAQALAEGAYLHAKKVKEQPFVVAPPNDPNSCPSFCPECQGLNYRKDKDTGEVSECTRYRARLENHGISDPSRNTPA